LLLKEVEMNKIRYWRQERMLSQHELAAASDIPRFLIQLFEVGARQPNPMQLRDLAEALGLDLAKLEPKRKDADNVQSR
jgi:ribosome-binding protein aMBF1 (putative translation factor)